MLIFEPGPATVLHENVTKSIVETTVPLSSSRMLGITCVSCGRRLISEYSDINNEFCSLNAFADSSCMDDMYVIPQLLTRE